MRNWLLDNGHSCADPTPTQPTWRALPTQTCLVWLPWRSRSWWQPRNFVPSTAITWRHYVTRTSGAPRMRDRKRRPEVLGEAAGKEEQSPEWRPMIRCSPYGESKAGALKMNTHIGAQFCSNRHLDLGYAIWAEMDLQIASYLLPRIEWVHLSCSLSKGLLFWENTIIWPSIILINLFGSFGSTPMEIYE